LMRTRRAAGRVDLPDPSNTHIQGLRDRCTTRGIRYS
jgi:hypothetical protein